MTIDWENKVNPVNIPVEKLVIDNTVPKCSNILEAPEHFADERWWLLTGGSEVPYGENIADLDFQNDVSSENMPVVKLMNENSVPNYRDIHEGKVNVADRF